MAWWLLYFGCLTNFMLEFSCLLNYSSITACINSLSGAIHSLGQFTVWANSVSWSIHCLGQFTPLVNSLSGSIHCLGQLGGPGGAGNVKGLTIRIRLKSFISFIWSFACLLIKSLLESTSDVQSADLVLI